MEDLEQFYNICSTHTHTHTRKVNLYAGNWIDFICYITPDKSNYLKNNKPKMTIATLNQI